MIVRAAAWMVVFALWACSLSEGKLVRSNEHAAKRRAADAGLDASSGDAASPTARDASSAERDAAPADASSGGVGGKSMSGEPLAGQTAAGAAAKPGVNEPKPNGEPCRGNEDCANSNCKSGENGERRCYGALQLDQTCSQPYDCDGYSCVPQTFEGKTSVCVDKGACQMQGTCFADYGIAMCQLDQHCNPQAGSFNACFQEACGLAGSANAQCLAALPAQRSLNESGCCPPGGVFDGGSCNAAPQCGCAEDEKCTIDGSTGKPTCMPVGSALPGGSCAKPEDCTKGYGCVGNVCKQHCEGPEDTACAGGGACKPINFSAVATGAYFCTRPCDPFDSSSTAAPFVGCQEGQRCNPFPDGKSDCMWSGTIAAGDACDDGTGQPIFNGCESSSVCITPVLVCAPFCHVGEDDCESRDCRSFGAPRYFVGQIEVGFCALP
ncbi:MAG: hypothetical protein ABW321_22745 [Polyangiales bacterium]